MPGEDRGTAYYRARRAVMETASGIVASHLTSRPDQSGRRLETPAQANKTGIASENRNGVTIMARTSTAPAPHAARSAADAATTADPARPAVPARTTAPQRPSWPRCRPTRWGGRRSDHRPRRDQHRRRPAGLTRVREGRHRDPKGSRPGIADTWTPAAAPATLGGEVSPAEAPGASTSGAGQPADESVGSTTFRRVL
jgi:hypothetical protein